MCSKVCMVHICNGINNGEIESLPPRLGVQTLVMKIDGGAKDGSWPEARVEDQNVQKSINPCPSLLLRHAPMLQLRWASALLQPGEERDDGCSDGEHDEDYSCGDSLPRSACQSI